ncbi:hypothetical protein K488DRAFT_76391 [Vararia minispora EC-137]|uniref:Uncharacterized protein n=1 Tax=Vararia minispora EC-137 TaxID=1314806 RepID=A0ACB8QWX3_9AGAM|nr:hypothetical protein K488DRAFT_76391 [Vararia minispora EC-137]
MPGIFSWTYHSAYARTRRIRAAPFLARTDTNVSRVATAMANQPAPGDVVINMDPAVSADKQDTLFGPNVGIMSSGPKWTESLSEKKVALDELTPDVVKAWIDKSKEPVQPTTTLQALVNLKRPTLRLTPLQLDPADDVNTADAHDHHALEFEYDCDAPKCAIHVAVVLPPEAAVGSAGPLVTVYEGVFDGGFGRALRLADGATLELGRFDSAARQGNKGETPKADFPPPAAPEPAPAAPAASALHRRFAIPFPGPAIAVLDADQAAGGTSDEDARAKEREEGTEGALDEDGTPLQPANAQATYLHVMRYGVHAPDAEDEDTRPWVVKVVKREATIGPHTFHLHEIYGLSSAAAAHPPPPTAPLPSPTTYPPTPAAAAPAREDEPSSECLLCLSAPREVVLLPCRHLVACKECALNMVEFGAGGQIVHNDEPSTTEAPAPTPATPAQTGAETADAPASGVPPVSAVTVHPPPPAQRQRKRRAKGWFCPVCRQPYTSLLRITTVPPGPEDKEGKRVSTSTVGEHDHSHPLAMPAPAHVNG